MSSIPLIAQPQDSVVERPKLRIRRGRSVVVAMDLVACYFTRTGRVEPRFDQTLRLAAHELVGKFTYKMYEYALPGDYVGLVRKYEFGKKHTELKTIVDFHVTPTHPQLHEHNWHLRVLEMYRVLKVYRPKGCLTHA